MGVRERGWGGGDDGGLEKHEGQGQGYLWELVYEEAEWTCN